MTYSSTPGAKPRAPHKAPPQTGSAGAASGVIALLRDATTLAQALHQVSTYYQGVGLSAHAWLTVARRMVAGQGWTQAVADAQAKNSQVTPGQVPHFTDPLVVLAGKSGLAEIAGQQRISAAGESIISAT